MWNNIPASLRKYKQWCLSKYHEGNFPLGIANGQFYNISINDETQFLDFDTVVKLAQENNCNFGFILTKKDPFTCIDLDIIDQDSQLRKGKEVNPAKWTTKEDKDRFWSIVTTLNSYSEFSASGKGIHIWVEGDIGAGRRRDSIEIYSNSRYICCTGNVILNKPLSNAQSYLENMKKQIPEIVQILDAEIEYSDFEIYELASNAENREKYLELSDKGDWQKYNYPSQSEADLALMSIIAFYSKNNAQCKRIFRCSKLGERDKATKNDKYLNFTLGLIRDRQNKEQATLAAQDELVNNLIATLNVNPNSNQFLHTDKNLSSIPEHKITAVEFGKINQLPETPNGIDWPPGLLGHIAAYIYNTAPRPVKEIAIAASLGLMAGIAGKSWSITQSGLNLYIVLLARSGVGKEALHSGITSLVRHVESREPSISQFIDLTSYVSGPALMKGILKNPCFVNIYGEWGKKLRQFAKEDGRNANAEGLRTVITEIYQKSGPGNLVGGMGYSKKDDSVSTVTGAAYSFLAETTPETFFEILTPSMMADGFLSRFTHIEYNGLRNPLNPNMLNEPESWLCDALAEISSYSSDLIKRDINIAVGRTESVAKNLASFEQECDYEINNSTDESYRQMWNRAGLKTAKIAAILAVCDNYLNPVIADQHLTWAIQLVRADIKLTSSRFESGDIGNGDSSRELKLLSIIGKYLSDIHSLKEGTVNHRLCSNGVISRQYIQTKIASVNIFEKHHSGSIRALDATLSAMIDNGYIVEVDKLARVADYGFNGKCYKILNLF